MGKKSSPVNKVSVNVENTTNTETPSPPPIDTVVAPAPEKKERKKRTKKTVVVENVPEPVVEDTTTTNVEDVNTETVVEEDNTEIVENVVDDVATTTVSDPTTSDKKKRRLVTKDGFLKLSEELQTELTPLLEENKKLAKMFKVFVNDAYRLLKIKTQQKKQKDATNSGFMRPVKPSIALEKFLTHIGENSTQPLTRAHLTTIICKYIKENDLQNPKDRRIIFPDDEFKKLFQITENETEPLTYYNIQKRIQSHVSRIEE